MSTSIPPPPTATCRILWYLVFLLLLFHGTQVQSSILGIDLGSEYLKVAKLQPGTGVSVVHNDQSKRKTPCVLSFLPDGSIVFGDLAVASTVKYPNQTVVHPLDYLQRWEQPDGLLYRQGLSHNAQMVALFLKQAFKIANTTPSATTAALVIPAWMDMEQRRNMLFACELLDASSVALIHSNTANAISYMLEWMSRTTQEQQVSSLQRTILLIDMGGTSATATIVSIARNNGKNSSNYSDSGKNRTSRYHFKVHSHVWDKSIGGQYMDERIADWIFHKAIASREEKDEKKYNMTEKSRIRLLQEAKRIKEILSVNQETVANIDNIFDSMDIQVPIYRHEIESMFSSYRDALHRLIHHSLLLAHLSKVDAIVPFGGTSRIPLIQDALKQSSFPLNRNIHADEAAAYGATYFAASLKMRSSTLEIEEWQTFDVWMQIRGTNSSLLWNASLFHVGDSLPITQQVVLSHPTTDLHIHLYAFRNASLASLLENRKDATITNHSNSQWLGNATFHVALDKDENGGCDSSLVRIEMGMNLQGFLSPPELEWICTNSSVKEQRRKPLQAVLLEDHSPWLWIPHRNRSSLLDSLQSQLEERQEKDVMVRQYSDKCNELESRILLYRQRLRNPSHEWNVYASETEIKKLLEYLDALEDWVVEQSTSHPFTLTKDNPTSLMRQKEQALEERILPIQKRMEANQQIQNAIEQLNSTLILAKQLAVQEERNLTSSSTVVPLQSLVDRWETWLNLRWKEYTEKEPFDDSRIQLVDIEQCNAATQTIWSEIAKLYRTKTTTTIGEKENPSNATTTAHDEL